MGKNDKRNGAESEDLTAQETNQSVDAMGAPEPAAVPPASEAAPEVPAEAPVEAPVPTPDGTQIPIEVNFPVRCTDCGNVTTEFVGEPTLGEGKDGPEFIGAQCLDCHTRPAPSTEMVSHTDVLDTCHLKIRDDNGQEYEGPTIPAWLADELCAVVPHDAKHQYLSSLIIREDRLAVTTSPHAQAYEVHRGDRKEWPANWPPLVCQDCREKGGWTSVGTGIGRLQCGLCHDFGGCNPAVQKG